MADTKNPQPPTDATASTAPEANDQDFQVVLKALLAAYQPIIQKDLELAKDPKQLQEEALRRCERICEEELVLANQLFDRFFTPEIAVALLPQEARQRFGAVNQWEWCFWHIRCCMVFGWLVCRAPRTFRAFVYYLYRYWICIRFSNKLPERLTAEDRKDFETLVGALAGAYKPYLKDQLASVEFPGGIPEEAIAGNIDCLEGEEGFGDVFERLLSVDAARALLGKEAFERYSKEPIFWFCRCWCLCAIRFGCCLARSRSLYEVWCCLLDYWRCIRNCFRPLVCGITDPALGACAEAVFVGACNPPVAGIHIGGTASGSAFHHYILSYSWGGGPHVTDAVVYPNCARPPAQTSSNVPVMGGTLGYLDVTLLPPGETEFTVYLDVFDSGAGEVSCADTFKVRTTAIEITAAAKVHALVADDPFNLGFFTKLIKATNDPNPAVPELSIGGAFSVDGSAYVVGCDRIMSQFEMTRYTLNPLLPVPDFTQESPTALLATGAVVYDDIPGHPWQSGCFPVITPNIILNGDLVAAWASLGCVFLGFPYTVPKVEAVPFWDSNPLNGRFVLHLEVWDRLLPGGPFPGDRAGHDQVAVWIDNQQPVGLIKSIGGITGCGDLHLKDYVVKKAEILGQAWDPPIDPTIPGPPQRPNDNFGGYNLTFQKNADPAASGNIGGGGPNDRVPNNVWPGPLGGAVDVLSDWDIVAALDGGAGPLPLHSPKIVRGDRCAYVINLVVWDTTHVGDSGGNHVAIPNPFQYAVNIINDIGT